MPKRSGVLTPPERVFSERYAATGDRDYAGTKAKYSQPAVGASKALQRPAVQAEIQRIQLERLKNEVLPLAVNAHIRLLSDPKTPAGAMGSLIKLAYDRTLGGATGEGDKEGHEMTPEEMGRATAAALMEMRQQLAEASRVTIDQEPVEVQPEEDVFG